MTSAIAKYGYDDFEDDLRRSRLSPGGRDVDRRSTERVTTAVRPGSQQRTRTIRS